MRQSMRNDHCSCCCFLWQQACKSPAAPLKTHTNRFTYTTSCMCLVSWRTVVCLAINLHGFTASFTYQTTHCFTQRTYMCYLCATICYSDHNWREWICSEILAISQWNVKMLFVLTVKQKWISSVYKPVLCHKGALNLIVVDPTFADLMILFKGEYHAHVTKYGKRTDIYGSN